MGCIQCKIKMVGVALAKLWELNKSLEKLKERASRPPGLPVPNPTQSYWLEDPPFPELVDMQSPVLPDQADIVIIGSGITGAAVARTVLQECERKGETRRVVVLEARSLCSGATGRNGGHIKPSPHETFVEAKKSLGPQQASKLARFQLGHVKYLTELCEAEGWQVAECREVETVDVYLDDKSRDKAFREVKEMREWIPELKIETWDAAAARKKFDVNDYVVGAISYTAGALWPFRFVSCVWRDLLDRFSKNLSLETGTTVRSVVPGTQKDSAYEVATNRGSIKCHHVVHATNAFASQFIPGLRGKMTSALAHMSAQRPGKEFPNYDGSRSWLIVYGDPGYDYVTQRPTVDGVPGDLMVGGGFKFGKGDGMDRIGVYDDSPVQMDALSVTHISAIMPTIFQPNWGNDDTEGRMKKIWTGLVAMTGDWMPFVGRLDPKLTGRQPGPSRRTESTEAVQPSEWVAAGFCGDGMVWAWLSGTAIGLMLMGTSTDELPSVPGRPAGKLMDWFPEDLMPTLDRVKRVDLADLVS